MRNVKGWVSGGLVTVLVIGLGGNVLAGARQVVDFDARIEATDSSVLSNDGNADYVGRQAVATVENYPAGDRKGDSFRFSPWIATESRTISFQHPEIENGGHITCNAGNVWFESGGRPDRAPSDWWEEVLEQGSTMGQAIVRCFLDDNRAYLVSFPLASAESGEEELDECVSFAKTGDSTFAISAEPYVPESTSQPENGGSGGSGGTGIGPIDDLLGDGEEESDEEPEVIPASGCPATIEMMHREKGHWVTQGDPLTEQSAPFHLELSLR